MAHSPSETPSLDEIERKFIIKEIPPFMRLQLKKFIEQGYLPSFRIRKIGNEYKMTIKEGSGVKRFELEKDIEQREYENFWEIGKEISLEKTRFYMEYEGHTLEADEYHGELDGLFTIEVEFKTEEEAEAFVPPEWFGEEVTHVKEFSNRNLAKDGITEVVRNKMERVNQIMQTPRQILVNLNDGVDWIVNGVLAQIEKIDENESVIVLITGGSNSGKTSFVTEKVMKILKEKGITSSKVSTDHFCHGPTYVLGRGMNFDQIESYNMQLCSEKIGLLAKGESVKIPLYDFNTDPMPDGQEVEKAKVYLVEGLFSLDEVITSKYGHLKVFVNVTPHGRLIRRLLRDAIKEKRTGQNELQALEQILGTVEPMDKLYVQPQKAKADIIIDNDYDPKVEHVNIPLKQNQVKISFGTQAYKDINSVLLEKGFIKSGSGMQFDEFLTHEITDLASRGEILRLRADEGNDRRLLTYKYPLYEESGRKDIMFGFHLEENLAEMLEHEYSKLCFISKYRETYTRGDISITVDTDVTGMKYPEKEMVGLGNFIEIRGHSDMAELVKLVDEIMRGMIDNESILPMQTNYFNMLLTA